ncbi:DUF418 domain-containing protein [Metabacillus fastidiosus]|uniref:DUF418 domain-containing protein n=1 Tax=Metabacillus fastidiosus TaxID=1458 RepID=UPI002E245D5A|nr:DUF418 domain-containing protein [Metabacillus fastidiosus]
MEGNNKRIRLLDILRGFAVLGTLGTNIWIFAHLGDLSYVFTYDHYVWWESFEDFIRIFVLFLVNGKFLGLLTIMFGVGLELKYQQSLRRGGAWPGIYIWISIILIMEGFLHFMLVMEYDILMSYGVTAIIVSFIVKGGDRIIARAMKIIGGLHAGFILLILIQGILFNISGAQISIGDMKEVVILYKDGTWIEQVQYRLMNFLTLRTEVIFLIPLNIFLFLLGVRLMRAGVFSPDENGKKQREKLFKLGLYIGVPLNLLIFIPGGIFDFPVRYLFAPLLSLGYLAVIAKIVERNKEFWLWNKLENVGKMSLSCYVLQNIASVIIFYGWGFDFGNKVDSITIIIIWFGLSSFQIIFANFWLHYFKFGPMETIRRSALKLITK